MGGDGFLLAAPSWRGAPNAKNGALTATTSSWGHAIGSGAVSIFACSLSRGFLPAARFPPLRSRPSSIASHCADSYSAIYPFSTLLIIEDRKRTHRAICEKSAPERESIPNRRAAEKPCTPERIGVYNGRPSTISYPYFDAGDSFLLHRRRHRAELQAISRDTYIIHNPI